MTKIEWVKNADGSQGKAWNPIVGCSIVSPGCTNCYAMRMAARIEAMGDSAVKAGKAVPGAHYAGTTKWINGNPVWTGKVALAPEHILTEPLRRKKPTMWFVNSMGDLFHEDVPDEWIDRVFAVMARCPQHTFQVLTKRSGRMRDYIRALDREPGPVAIEIAEAAAHGPSTIWPLPNVWLGVSAERQQEADARIPDLLATPAAVRFVSAEPLLGPVDFTRILVQSGIDIHSDAKIDALQGERYMGAEPPARDADTFVSWVANPCEPPVLPSLNWIIVGGESGPGARPMHPAWARSIRDQCQAAGVPFFFKQWGDFHAGRKVGKARAGRLLDGIEHNGMPSAKTPEAAA